MLRSCVQLHMLYLDRHRKEQMVRKTIIIVMVLIIITTILLPYAWKGSVAVERLSGREVNRLRETKPATLLTKFTNPIIFAQGVRTR